MQKSTNIRIKIDTEKRWLRQAD